MMNTNFANNLKKLRKKFGYSQEKFAEMIGYSPKNVSKWETGQSIPNVDVLEEICHIFSLNSIDMLINSEIEYYEQDVKLDDDFCIRNSINIGKACIEFYYKLLQNDTMIKTEIDDEVYEYLVKLKENNLIKEFTINQTDQKLYIRYCLCSLGPIRTVLKKNDANKINFADDNEFYEFIDNLKLNKQVTIVLNFIEGLTNDMFSLKDIYSEKLIEELTKLYQKNKDHKKIIRTSLAKLCEYGVIDKIGYAQYKKKHHKINYADYELTNEKIKYIDSILKLTFDDMVNVRKYKLEDLKTINQDINQLNNILNAYLIYLRNLSLINAFNLLANNEEIIIEYNVD